MSKENEITCRIEAKAYKRIRKELVKSHIYEFKNFDDYLSYFNLAEFIEQSPCLKSYLLSLFDPDVNADISKRDLMRCLLEDMSFSEIRALEGLVSHDELYETFLKEFQKTKFNDLKSSLNIIIKLRDSMQRFYAKQKVDLQAA